MKYLITIIALFFMLQGNAQNQDFTFAKVLIVKKEQEGINYKMKLIFYGHDRKPIKKEEAYVSKRMYHRLKKDGFYTPGQFYNTDACNDCGGKSR